MFKNKFPQKLYHSYVIEGDPYILSKKLISFLEENKYISKNSPDVLIQNYDGFSIGDSSAIKEWHSIKGEEDKKRICILGTKFINREAEHSLLKIFEEPAKNTHFFLIIPNSDSLLPTIISRAHVIKFFEEENNFEIKRAKEFIQQSPKNRIELISKIIKLHKKDETSASLRNDAINLLNSIEKILHKDLNKNKDLIFSLEEIQNAREYLNLPGSSVKMLLEHVALVI